MPRTPFIPVAILLPVTGLMVAGYMYSAADRSLREAKQAESAAFTEMNAALRSPTRRHEREVEKYDSAKSAAAAAGAEMRRTQTLCLVALSLAFLWGGGFWWAATRGAATTPNAPDTT